MKRFGKKTGGGSRKCFRLLTGAALYLAVSFMAPENAPTGGIIAAAAENTGEFGPEVTCLDPAGKELVGNWEYVGKEWRFRFTNGTYAKSKWLKYQDRWYYADYEGYLKTEDKVKLSGHEYYFDENGAMLTGWLLDNEDGRWHLIKEDGSMTTGWVKAGGSWYLFDSRGRLYVGGKHMGDGRLYNFYDNGKLIAGGFIRTKFYNADGVHDPDGDIVLYGSRRPVRTEDDKLTEVFSEIPSQWVNRFREDGWQLMWYTDKIYLSAPMTDRGIWYVKYKTDIDYKKIKFTDPEAVRMGFGEYIASVLLKTVSTRDALELAVGEYQEFASTSAIAPSLPDYFSDDERAMSAVMFCGYFDPAVREELRKNEPELAAQIEELLGIGEDRKPEAYEMDENGGMGYGSAGPASEKDRTPAIGPASDPKEQKTSETEQRQETE